MIFADILNIITIFQLLLLSSVLLFVGKNKRATRFLVLFFIIQSSGIIDAMFWRYFQWSIENVAHVFFIPHMISKMWGPALMFYVMSMISPSFKLRKIHLLHLIPMVSFGVLMYIIYFRYPLSIKKTMLLTNTVFSTLLLIILITITLLMNFSYLGYILFHLKRYSSGLYDYYSSTKTKNFKWLQFVIFAFSFLWFVALIQYSTSLIFGINWQLINLTNPIIFVITCYIVIYGWITPEIFISSSQKGKYQKYPLSDQQKKIYIEQLDSVMQREKPFLDPELTLTELSQKTSIPERHLSQVINKNIGLNFYDYINTFRIQESIKYLVSNPVKKNILEILLDAGFNSKTAFNVTFKKFTGMSPSEYKKTNLTSKFS